MDRRRVIAFTLALIASIAVPLCASPGWARGLGVLGVCGGGGGEVCSTSNDSLIVPSENTPTSAYGHSMWVARRVVLGSDIVATGLMWSVYRNAAVATSVKGEIWTDNGGLPGAVVSGASSEDTSLVNDTIEDIEMQFSSAVTISSGTYWIVMQPSVAVKWGYRTEGGVGTYKYTTNGGSSWNNLSEKLSLGVYGCD